MDILISVLAVIITGAIVTVSVFAINLAVQLKATAKSVEETLKRVERSMDGVDETVRSYSDLAKSVEARVESTREVFDIINAVTRGAKTGWLNIAKFGLGFLTNLKRG